MLTGRLVGLVVASTLAGCAVVDPPGWAQRQVLPITKVTAKPWVMYGVAPYRWVSRLGEIEVEQDQGLTVVGPRCPRMRFHVRFRGSEEPGLTCQMYVAPAGVFAPHEETHGALFGCISVVRGVVSSVGKGCRYPADVFDPSCHQGQLRIGEDRFRVGQGFLKMGKAPVGYLSFTSLHGELLGAADIVTRMNMRLWMRPATSEAERQRQRSLVLLAVAFHQFRHIVFG